MKQSWWAHYRKTFLGVQAAIALVTVGVAMFANVPQAVATFVVMQLGAVVGSVWAASLKTRIARRADALPLRSVN